MSALTKKKKKTFAPETKAVKQIVQLDCNFYKLPFINMIQVQEHVLFTRVMDVTRERRNVDL